MSSTIQVHLDGDGVWPDLATRSKDIIHLGNDSTIEIAALSEGTVAGRPSITLRINLPDGRVVLVETTLRVFLLAADTLRARY